MRRPGLAIIEPLEIIAPFEMRDVPPIAVVVRAGAPIRGVRIMGVRIRGVRIMGVEIAAMPGAMPVVSPRLSGIPLSAMVPIAGVPMIPVEMAGAAISLVAGAAAMIPGAIPAVMTPADLTPACMAPAWPAAVIRLPSGPTMVDLAAGPSRIAPPTIMQM